MDTSSRKRGSAGVLITCNLDTPSLCPTHTHLLLHQFELLLELSIVPVLLQPDPLGLLPAAHRVVLLHLLHLLLLLTLQVLQLCVEELLLGLEEAEGEI